MEIKPNSAHPARVSTKSSPDSPAQVKKATTVGGPYISNPVSFKGKHFDADRAQFPKVDARMQRGATLAFAYLQGKIEARFTRRDVLVIHSR